MITKDDVKPGVKFRILSKSIGCPFMTLAKKEIEANEVYWKDEENEIFIGGFRFAPKDLERIK